MTPASWSTRAWALLAAGALVLAGLAVVQLDRAPTAPNCARYQGEGATARSASTCQAQVTDWCAANHPEDDTARCIDKVYGFATTHY